MALGERMREARDAAEMTQLEFGFEVNMSRSAIGMIEIEERKLPKEVSRKAVEVLDDGFFSMAAAEEAVGHSWVPKLDGEYVDLHRSSVAKKAEEELNEALEAIGRMCLVNHPKSMDKHGRAELREALLQVVDAIVALSTYAAVICREYSLSWVKLWRDHRKKLKERGYVKR